VRVGTSEKAQRLPETRIGMLAVGHRPRPHPTAQRQIVGIKIINADKPHQAVRNRVDSPVCYSRYDIA
jgi:hypothetical protein